MCLFASTAGNNNIARRLVAVRAGRQKRAMCVVTVAAYIICHLSSSDTRIMPSTVPAVLALLGLYFTGLVIIMKPKVSAWNILSHMLYETRTVWVSRGRSAAAYT
jgi:hypothetical protein